MRSLSTAVQDIVISTICEGVIGESRFNRTADEYTAMCKKIPKLDSCHAYVNEYLAKIAKAGNGSHGQICDFKAGDTIIRYRNFPGSVSRETVRLALINYGFRVPREVRKRAA